MVYMAQTGIRVAENNISGALYDLTRSDKHPNDIHKAVAKLEKALEVLDGVKKELRESSEGAA